jgi:hypothetical protein
MVVILHTVDSNAWLLTDAFLLSSWDKLASRLTQAPFFTYIPFSLSSAISTGLIPDAFFSAHWRPLLNAHGNFFLLDTAPTYRYLNESLLDEATTGCLSIAIQDQNIELGHAQYLLTFALGIQTSSGLSGC